MYNPKKGEILANLFGIDIEMKESFYGCVAELTEKYKKRIKLAEYYFRLGKFKAKTRQFTAAHENFTYSERIYGSVGNKRKEALSKEMQAICFVKRHPALTHTAEIDAKTALKIYEKIGDIQSVQRINELLSIIFEMQKEGKGARRDEIEFPESELCDKSESPNSGEPV